MADRFKNDRNKEDLTFYSMSKKQKEDKKTKKKITKFSTGKYMFCTKCAGNPIIKVDNANKYVCSNCLMKTIEDKTIWKM